MNLDNIRIDVSRLTYQELQELECWLEQMTMAVYREIKARDLSKEEDFKFES
jgi:hypothetical protein